jgi:hypothetical protein
LRPKETSKKLFLFEGNQKAVADNAKRNPRPMDNELISKLDQWLGAHRPDYHATLQPGVHGWPTLSVRWQMDRLSCIRNVCFAQQFGDARTILGLIMVAAAVVSLSQWWALRK